VFRETWARLIAEARQDIAVLVMSDGGQVAAHYMDL
jgi:hypothetical protein